MRSNKTSKDQTTQWKWMNRMVKVQDTFEVPSEYTVTDGSVPDMGYGTRTVVLDTYQVTVKLHRLVNNLSCRGGWGLQRGHKRQPFTYRGGSDVHGFHSRTLTQKRAESVGQWFRMR